MGLRRIGRMMKPIRPGTQYGLWKVLGSWRRAGEGKSCHIEWLVKCECGKQCWRTGSLLRANRTNGCGSCVHKGRFDHGKRDAEIRRRYSETPDSMAAIGRGYGITRQRVEQIVNRTKEKI